MSTKKILISFGLITISLIVLFFVFLIGITTDFLSDKIEDADIVKCKEIVTIIERNKAFIKDSISKDADGDGECIRYFIENEKDIDKLFSKISQTDKQRFNELIKSKFCEYVEIGEPKNCIMFCMKTSNHNWSIIGKYKKMFIIYEKTPRCNCKDSPIGDPNYAEYVKKLSDNWYQTKVRISRRHFGC
ncbi:hypothetical protein [Flavobacterium reichenbachii]|uniref:Uncharacterized protein n=1 Tax=Flavobacterium reichenbachii TaxID=362418 RepID=A0A085ZJC4_9FLAO|nr:hypothetical protein [Flavobacterium reichenbachii]KFF04538.1 hypothetical protein IW19_02900 [Flavobacterium reichenbachii]OXB09281.1 hypothetical protein B0A68_24010 [Flavobacterium reichenbachii]